jgi:stage V sporulation protein SpoVS
MMRVLTVTSKSNLSELSQSLVQFLRVDSLVAIEAAGQGAVEQLLQTLIKLRRLWQAEEAELVFIADVQSAGESDTDEPYVRLTLATSPHIETLDREQEITDEIRAQFDDWQTMPDDDNELLKKIRLYHAESPILSGGDLDAAWDQADVGDETVGGDSPTPDQDVVEELGEAVGLTYEDDEPLHSAEKLQERDAERWELDPASAEEETGS